MSKMRNQLVLFPDVLSFQEGPGVRNTQYTTEGVKLLNVANLVDGHIDLSTSDRYISEEEAYGKYKHFLCDAGDFVVASSGIKVEYIDKKMGFVDESMLPLCMNTSTIRFKVLDKNTLRIRYFMYYLKTQRFKEQLERQITGSAQLNYGPSHLKKMALPLVDIRTQDEIIERLDCIHNIITQRQEELQMLDDLIKARFVEMFGDAVSNPYGYEQVTIGDACSLINGRAFKPTDWGDEGLPIVRIQNLNDPKAPFNYYDGQISKQHLIDSGLLLFSWSGTPGTSFGAFMWNRGPGVLNQHIFKVIPKLDFDLDYLRYAMNGQLATIISKAHGGVGLQHITKSELEKILILYPKLDEQKRFTAFVAQVDKSKAVVQKALDEAQLLFDSLMQKYFG